MTDRATTAGEVQTVLGPVSPASLGLVLPHKHILCNVPPPELKAASLPEFEITLQNARDVRYHWIKTIKIELIWRTTYTSRWQATKAIGEYIEGFYNPRRQHSSLDYKSPAAFETAFHATIRQSNRPSTDTGEVQGDDNCRNDGCETELHADAVDHLAGQQMFV